MDINDISHDMATTAFVEGSHVFPLNINSKLERYNINLFKNIFTPCYGKTGDIFIFFNKVWHGLKPSDNFNQINNIPNESARLLFAFNSEGFSHTLKKNIPKVTEYGKDFSTSIGDGLYKMINEDNFKSVDKDQSSIVLEKTGNENLINKISQTKHFTVKSIFILLIALFLIHSLRIAKFFYHNIKKYNI